MLRLLLISIPTILIACSSDRPRPVAPAGKATDYDCALCDLFGAFNDQQEEEAETDSTSSEGGPDLIVQSPSASAVMLTPGQTFTLHVTVHNQGDQQAAATRLHYYRSNNSTITASDTEVGTDTLDSLDASATSKQSIELTASVGVERYYGACVASVRGESNTDNNCSSAVKITVNGQETPADTSQVAVEDDPLPLEESTLPETETDVDFNIEIVFLDDFDPDKRAWIEEIASQWEMFFYDMDDYVFDNTIELPIHAGLNVRFEKGEVIDDIRIYVDKFSKASNYTTAWGEQPYGLGDVVLFRPDGDVPVIGIVLMNDNRMEKQREEGNESSHFMEFLWRKTFHHEMGHALGIGPSPAWVRNVYWQDNANAWFTGPNAVREYRLMAPDDDSPGVPLSESSIQKPRIAPHWEPHGPMQWGFFGTYFLQDNGLPNITRTALGAFHDIGWNVNYEMGLPKIPDHILPCWLLGDIGNFHLCPREE